MGTRTKDQDRESCGSEVWEEGRGDGSGSAKPVASERAKRRPLFFQSPLARVLRDDGNEPEQKSGWMGWKADGGASTGTGRILYPRECVRCAALCCACAVDAAGHSLQGSIGLYRGSAETHLAHSIEHGIQHRLVLASAAVHELQSIEGHMY